MMVYSTHVAASYDPLLPCPVPAMSETRLQLPNLSVALRVCAKVCRHQRFVQKALPVADCACAHVLPYVTHTLSQLSCSILVI